MNFNQLLEKSVLSHRELARQAGVSRNTLKNMRDNKPVKRESGNKILRILNVELQTGYTLKDLHINIVGGYADERTAETDRAAN